MPLPGAVPLPAPLVPDPFAPPPAPPPPAPPPVAPPAPLADGTYGGEAVLTAFHGDCNAGGTGRLVLRRGVICYEDAQTRPLCGPLPPPGGEARLRRGATLVELRAQPPFLLGTVRNPTCSYRFRYARIGP